MKDCAMIECLYNDKLRKGMCIGLSNNVRSYVKDVVRMCWVDGKKPSLDKQCDVETDVQMTPDEARDLGAALILGWKLGGRMLEVQEMEKAKELKEAKLREKPREK